MFMAIMGQRGTHGDNYQDSKDHGTKRSLSAARIFAGIHRPSAKGRTEAVTNVSSAARRQVGFWVAVVTTGDTRLER
jgi:hypothetical protein